MDRRLENPSYLVLVRVPDVIVCLTIFRQCHGYDIDPDTPFLESGNCNGYGSLFDQRHKFNEHAILLLHDLATSGHLFCDSWRHDRRFGSRSFEVRDRGTSRGVSVRRCLFPWQCIAKSMKNTGKTSNSNGHKRVHPTQKLTAITNARVFDGERVIDERTVLIDGSHIR